MKTLDSIAPKYKQEVLNRMVKSAKKKLEEYHMKVEKYTKLQRSYETWVAKGSKGYDVGSYDRELKSAIFWYNKHKLNTSELLLIG